MAASFSEIERIIERYDAATAGLDAAVSDRIADSLDASFRNLDRELRRQYPTWQSEGSLFASQRRLLLLTELGDLLQVIRPELRTEYQALLTETLQTAHTSGSTLADELIATRDPGYPLQEFTAIPIEAAVAQARDGVDRLYRYNDDFKAAASSIVEQGLIQGWGAGKVSGLLARELGVTKSKAETLARTEIMSALNTAAEERYEKAGITLVQWQSAPAEASCSYCLARNGNVYEVGTASIPAHPRCRCVWLPFSKKWQQRGLTQDAAVGTAAAEAIARFEAAGGRLNTGPTYWEKKAGLTEAPTAVWKPGDAVVVEKKANPLPLHQQLINRGKDTFSGQAAAIESAYATAPNKAALKAATSKLSKLERQYLKAAEAPDVDLFKVDTLRMQILNATDALKSIENARENAVKDSFRSLKGSLGQGSDSTATKTNASAVSIPRKSKNNPYEKQDYAAILTDLYAATNNQVTTLEKLYYKEPRAFAAQPGIKYKGEVNDTTGRINVGKSSNLTYHTQVLWHEYGHHLEYSNPEYAEAAREWIKSKATSDTPQKLNNLVPGSGYGDSEVAYPDKFIDPYVGRFYKQGTTEVVSMGLEHLSTPALMRRLYETDPDHFFLILGMLR